MVAWHSGEHPERLAYAMWSAIAESTLPVAHTLIATYGPIGALDRVASWVDRGAPGPYRDALDRLAPRLATTSIERLVDRHLAYGGFVLTPEDDAWPEGLNDLGPAAPLALWGRGGAALGPVPERGAPNVGPGSVESPTAGGSGTGMIAMVGARAATGYGLDFATTASGQLATMGYTVVSGGAYGIDAAAHRGALAAAGRTVAVLAGGPDRLYPAGNTELLHAIEAEGMILSEHPPGRQPARFRFLQRNRLIAALGAATVVVQAALRSGALHTARRAAELGRGVGAVPGPVTEQMSAGCHEAVRSGFATLVTDAAEIAELASAIGQVDASKHSHRRGVLDGLDPLQARVYDALPASGSAELVTLADVSGLSVGEVRSALGYLQLAGRVEVRGERYRRSR